MLSSNEPTHDGKFEDTVLDCEVVSSSGAAFLLKPLILRIETFRRTWSKIIGFNLGRFFNFVASLRICSHS